MLKRVIQKFKSINSFFRLKMYVEFQQKLYYFELLLNVDILKEAEMDDDRKDLYRENRLMITYN